LHAIIAKTSNWPDIKQNLRDAGKNVDKLTTTDLATAKVPADLDLASWAKRCD
jgi:hypothetical protein